MFDIDDVFEIGAELVKGVGSFVGAGVGASIGIDFVDSLFDE